MLGLSSERENDMTNSPDPVNDDELANGAGVKRPDQGGTDKPGQQPGQSAPGGDGAAGAGGPKGFGTGT